jgi:ferredoxin
MDSLALAKYMEYAKNIVSLRAPVQAIEGEPRNGRIIFKHRKEEPMAQKVVIDADECVACGTCVEICPEVFKMDDGADTAEVIMETGGPEDLIQEAIDSCPTQCISLED